MEEVYKGSVRFPPRYVVVYTFKQIAVMEDGTRAGAIEMFARAEGVNRPYLGVVQKEHGTPNDETLDRMATNLLASLQ